MGNFIANSSAGLKLNSHESAVRLRQAWRPHSGVRIAASVLRSVFAV
jgi:hypothetical protein